LCPSLWCGFFAIREQVAEGKEKGVPGVLLAEDAVIDLSLKLSAAQQALVLGGEACVWTEIVTDQMLDGRLWPAAAALAECFWSPATLGDTSRAALTPAITEAPAPPLDAPNHMRV